jgi:hypothetical protein
MTTLKNLVNLTFGLVGALLTVRHRKLKGA